MEIRNRLSRLARMPVFWVGVIAVATLIIRFVIINNPAEVVFDEYYYVGDARKIIHGQGELRHEHPPLGQLVIALGMLIFGDTAPGWRIFPVLFGTASVIFFYLICRQLKLSGRASVFATFLLATENQFFIQSNIAMLDVFSLTFMLAAFYFYLRRSYPLAGVFIALSTLSKLTGAVGMIVIVLHWLMARRDSPRLFGLSVLLAPLLFFELLMPLDYIATGKFVEPVGRVWNMLAASRSITMEYSTHPFESYPWDWVLKPLVMPYWYEPYYSGTISFTLWALIIPAVVYLSFRAKQGNQAGLFSGLWFACTYFFWIVLSLITDRVTYVFYFYPVTGAVCLGVGMVLAEVVGFWERNRSSPLRIGAFAGVVLFFMAHLAVFVLLSPMVQSVPAWLKPVLTPPAPPTTPTTTNIP